MRMAHVKGNAEIGSSRIARKPCAVAADLLLTGGDKGHVRRAAHLLHQFRRAQHDGDTGAVVCRLRDITAVQQLQKPRFKADIIPDGDDLTDFVRSHTQVDEHILALVVFLPLLVAQKMGRFRADHAAQIFLAMHHHAHAGHDTRVNAADKRKANAAVLLDFFNHCADFIQMGADRDLRPRSLFMRIYAVQGADGDLVHQRLKGFCDILRRRALIARDAGQRGNVFQKVFGTQSVFPPYHPCGSLYQIAATM